MTDWPTGAGSYPPGVTDDDPHFIDSGCPCCGGSPDRCSCDLDDELCNGCGLCSHCCLCSEEDKEQV